MHCLLESMSWPQKDCSTFEGGFGSSSDRGSRCTADSSNSGSYQILPEDGAQSTIIKITHCKVHLTSPSNLWMCFVFSGKFAFNQVQS